MLCRFNKPKIQSKMSVNFNRAKGSKLTDSRSFKIKIFYDDPYWDEAINFYPKYRRGFKNPGKQLMSFQIRMYKTWKYNRKTQWKNK